MVLQRLSYELLEPYREIPCFWFDEILSKLERHHLKVRKITLSKKDRQHGSKPRDDTSGEPFVANQPGQMTETGIFHCRTGMTHDIVCPNELFSQAFVV